MKNFWKWILGIVIVLVVLFGLGIGSRLLMANLLLNLTGVADGFRHPMMDGRGFGLFGGMMHLGGGSMLLGGFFPLVLVGLLAYGAYLLGRRRNRVMPPAAAPTASKNCTDCGQPIQEGWKHCPHCGKQL